ncbi:MAG: hypothetical protein K8L91_16650 [Anaerolineae bacterium]|nr:hypothetical protein [Anaerolineae bacterium]
MVFLIVGVVVGIGLMLQVVQFYRGQRREFYLLYGRTWTFIAGLGATMVLWCCIGTITQMTHMPGSVVAMLLCISPTFWLAFSTMFLMLPPAWLREFEKEHSPFEVMLAINNAQVMLRQYPRAFRQTIRQRDGWELWLLTLGAWLELNEGGLQSPNRQALRDALAAPK